MGMIWQQRRLPRPPALHVQRAQMRGLLRLLPPYAIAADLSRRGIPTARGHRFWLTSQVRSMLNRLDRLSAVGLLDARNEGRSAL
jgi:hypothetical protein